MSEWLSYSLSDFLLFSPRTYYRLFALYNEAIWPAHLAAAGGGVAILWLTRRGAALRGRAVAAILAAGWLWVAWAYLLERYDTINWVARYFAIGFALETLLLAAFGVVLNRLRWQPASDASGRIGLAVFLFALVVQPLIGPLVGRPWQQAEIFGIAPDPTAVGTLGLLLALRGRVAWLLMVVPLLWCAISGATLRTMESPDWYVVPAAALLVLALATGRAVRK